MQLKVEILNECVNIICNAGGPGTYPPLDLLKLLSLDPLIQTIGSSIVLSSQGVYLRVHLSPNALMNMSSG
jgi:hypothetical protein